MLGAPAVIFFSLSTVTNAVLQGIDLMRKSVTHSAISLVVHAALVYVMLKYLNWGVYGLVIGNVTFALVVCVLNWARHWKSPALPSGSKNHIPAARRLRGCHGRDRVPGLFPG